jgi:exonuclease SbcD
VTTPATNQTRILFVGDMHLGRSLSSLPGHLDPGQLGPRVAWQRVVKAALAEQVHAVALAGDLVDRSNDLFEAYGLLKQGMQELQAAGISVCAVAGNHDTEVLPRLATELETLHLLGPGGSWTTQTVQGPGGPAVRLAGWSFPGRHHHRSPLEDGPPTAEPDSITLGLLHTALDGAGSPYAPVSTTALQALGYAGWFLGHEHKPGILPGDGAPYYLGSLTPLTPNETGPHGPVLVTVGQGPGPLVQQRRLWLAPLRWDHLTVDCSTLAHPAIELPGHLLPVITGHLERLLAEPDGQAEELKGLGLRLQLTGQVERAEELRATVAGLELDQLHIPDPRCPVFVQKVENRTSPRLDLTALARETHPAGILARQILLLEGGDVPGTTPAEAAAERADLLRAARDELASVDRAAQFAPLLTGESTAAPSAEKITELLLEAGRQALAHLLAGREVADGATD